MVYYRARYYDPETGRFTQRDPIGLSGGTNLYAYALGSPTNYTDPMGTRPPQVARILGSANVANQSYTSQGGADVQNQLGGTGYSQYPAAIGPNPAPSRAGIKQISQFERFESRVSPDPVGIPTIGFGHKVRAGESFQEPITRQQGVDLLHSDVKRVVTPGLRKVGVALTQNQVDALGSFIFNVGPAAFNDSTLLRKLNAGNFGAVPDELRRFVYAGGRKLPGLIRRREAEAQLFQK